MSGTCDPTVDSAMILGAYAELDALDPIKNFLPRKGQKA
jgi:hypothetical protein